MPSLIILPEARLCCSSEFDKYGLAIMSWQCLAKPTSSLASNDHWVALAIGNSRLHWGLFVGDRLQHTRHTPHLVTIPKTWHDVLPVFEDFSWNDNCPELWVASVVPAQTEIWLQYPRLNLIRLADVPLQHLYPTFGLDRAIALWGAGMTYGWPTLVLDGGTALTLTGADTKATLIGGAILPGLGLQLRSLHTDTAELPLTELPAQLPERWAKDTTAAIQSGILYTVIAGLNSTITQWSNNHPTSQIVFTGGDAQVLSAYFKQWEPEPQWLKHLVVDLNLPFQGIAALRGQRFLNP